MVELDKKRVPVRNYFHKLINISFFGKFFLPLFLLKEPSQDQSSSALSVGDANVKKKGPCLAGLGLRKLVHPAVSAERDSLDSDESLRRRSVKPLTDTGSSELPFPASPDVSHRHNLWTPLSLHGRRAIGTR